MKVGPVQTQQGKVLQGRKKTGKWRRNKNKNGLLKLNQG
jgi:hypothetical protein